jgi:hypothetical protein
MSEEKPQKDEPDIDRQIRIERMKGELDELAQGSMIGGGFGDVPPSLEESFLERVLAFEHAELDTTYNRLIERGCALEPPDELDEATLSARLRDLVGILATMRCFITDTDHLSDRQLYNWLWTDALRERVPDVEKLDGNWHISPIGSGDDENTWIFLKYYANEEERKCWQKEFPDYSLPAPESPLHDRDRHLPRAS